jgi:transcriptional regulator with XRE-family HTH domain
MSFQISLSPTRRAAGRFIEEVRRALQRALAEERQETGITQSDIANTIGVHRSVISRELRGDADMTLGRVAEIAASMGREARIEIVKDAAVPGQNEPTWRASPSTVSREWQPREQVSASANNSVLVAAR